MAAPRKKDWGETFLWVGVWILLIIFLYELLKLIQNGTAAASGFLTAVQQAASNALADVETALTALPTNPIGTITAGIALLPSFLSLVVGTIEGCFTGSFLGNLGFSGISSTLSNLFGSSVPLTNGQGSSYVGSTLTAPAGTNTPVTPASGATITDGSGDLLSNGAP